MTRLKLMFIPMVALVFGAGLIVGRITTRVPPIVAQPPATKPAPERGPSSLHDQLGLNAEQRKQMDAIWKDVMKSGGERWDRTRQFDKDRDQAIQDLLTPEQKTQYTAIQDAHRAKRTELDKERERLMAQANEKTRALLNDDQKKKWDDISKEMRDRRGPRGPRGGDRGGDRGERPGPGGPTSRPATGESNRP